jgi:hypothetical protein
VRIIETDSRLVLRDVPGVMWVFGLVFVASGLFVLSVPLLAPEWRGFGLWQRLAVLAIGAAHFGVGLYTTNQARATVTDLDLGQGLGSQRIRRLWSRWQGAHGAARTEFALADVRAVEIVESKDGDGDPMYQLRLWLRDSDSLWLQAQPAHGQAAAQERARRVRRFLRLDTPRGAG